MAGVWARGASKKIRDPLRIFATVEASNFKFGTQIAFGTSLPKTTFRTKISGGIGWGSIQLNWDPLRISATVEASNLKFGRLHKFGSGLAYQTTTVRTKIGGRLG